MTVEKMRARIIEVYAGPKWRCRVQEMDNRQVIAVYKRMEEDGLFEKMAKERERKRKQKGEPRCEQMTIFDLLKNEGEK